MKSEHRHELKEHELGRLTGQAQAFFEKHGNQVLLGVLGVILVVGGIIWWIRSSAASAAAGWQQFASARTAEDFASVIEKHPGTEVAQWARLNEAENHLVDAMQLAFSDREGANKSLEKAKKGFDGVLHSTPLSESLRERALFGLARTLESGSGRDTEQAVKAYQELADNFPLSPYRDAAARRAELLKTAGAQEFYAWFQSQNPKPEDLERPKDGLPAGHPPIDSKPEDKSADGHPLDLPLKPPPGLGDTEKKPDGNARPDDTKKPDEDKKPEDEKKPDAEKEPVSEKKPAGDAQPE